jgi:general secretion pathway protein M
VKPLTPRERRLLALGLLVLAVAAVYLLILGPLVSGVFDRAQQKSGLRQAYADDQRLIGSLPALRAAAEAQRATQRRFAIAAPNEVLAAEALKARLQRIAADEGFTVRAIDDLQADAPQGAVKLRADLTLTLTQFYETVRRLQNEDPYVIVDYTAVSADRSYGANRLEPLDVRLELEAQWRPSAGGRS